MSINFSKVQRLLVKECHWDICAAKQWAINSQLNKRPLVTKPSNGLSWNSEQYLPQETLISKMMLQAYLVGNSSNILKYLQVMRDRLDYGTIWIHGKIKSLPLHNLRNLIFFSCASNTDPKHKNHLQRGKKERWGYLVEIKQQEQVYMLTAETNSSWQLICKGFLYSTVYWVIYLNITTVH